MISRRDWEPLPTPTLSPFALARPGTFLRVGFFTAALWCVPALRVPLVHSLINHFRQNKDKYENTASYWFTLEQPKSGEMTEVYIPSTAFDLYNRPCPGLKKRFNALNTL